MLKNTDNAYGSVAKLFHWIMALLILGLFFLGLYMSDLELSPQKLQLYQWHKSLGATVLALAALRLCWRLWNIVPALPAGMALWERFGAHASHYALYALMFAMPLSGWIMSSYAGYPVSVFGWFTLPDLVAADKNMFRLMRDVHEALGWSIVALASVHAGAALWHHFIRKDNVLRRMLPLLLLLCAFPAQAADWTVDGAKSRIEFTAHYAATPIKGSLPQFTAAIAFDPADLPGSHVRIEIPIAPIDTANDERDGALRSADWFDVAQFPLALFEGKKFTALGGQKYRIDGTLTLRGKARDFGFDFTFSELTATRAVMDAAFPLNRLDFGVGQGEWANEKEVKAAVDVRLHIEAKR